jgi:DNA-binding transcriptional MerR regulator
MSIKKYTIGVIAKRFGITPVALRHYQKLGLLEPNQQSTSGYWLYSDHDLTRLGFILNAKSASFTLNEIKDLFAIVDKKGKSTAIKKLVKNKIDSIEMQIINLKKLKNMLITLDDTCQKKVIAKNCPIVKGLMG